MPVFSVAHAELLDPGYPVVAKTFVDTHREGYLRFLVVNFGEAEGYCDAVFDGLRTTLLGCGEERMGCVAE
jgi:hypothetical protein